MVSVCPLGVRSGRKNLRLFHFHSWGEGLQVPPRWTLPTMESRCLHVIPTFGEGQLLCVPRVLHENPKGMRSLKSNPRAVSEARICSLMFPSPCSKIWEPFQHGPQTLKHASYKISGYPALYSSTQLLPRPVMAAGVLVLRS